MKNSVEVITKVDRPQNKRTLTGPEQQMLEVLTNPEHFGKTVTEKIKLAGVSRDSWYRIIKLDYFIDKVNDTAIANVKSRIADVIEASYKYGLEGKNNYHDRRLLLTMSGLYKEGEQTLVNGNVNSIDFGNMSTDELKKMMEELKN